MNKEYTLKLPMRIRTSSKKVTALNLNIYRNLHFRSLSSLKNKFQEHGKKLLKNSNIPKLGRIRLEYKVFAKTKKEFDVANICSIVDKFFSDTLVHAGIIEDDNWKFLDSVSFGFGGFASDEYILVIITEIEPRKGDVMRILLEEDDIQTALESYVFDVLNVSGATGVELTSDDNGVITAEVLMGESKTTNTTTPSTPKKRGGRPAGSKNKTKEPEPDVDVHTEDSSDNDSTGTIKSTEEESKDTSSSETKGSASKNLFGDEEKESSKGDTPVKIESTPKKASIFDQ
jgi:hypothetical protein